MIVAFPAVPPRPRPRPSLHLNVGVEFIDLLPEAAAELGPLGLQGGGQQAVLDWKHLGM